MGRPGREEYDLVSLAGQPGLAGSLAQDALASVPEDRIAQSLRRNEGDSRGAAFVLS